MVSGRRRIARDVLRHRGASIGLLLVAAFVALSALSPWLSPHGPFEQDLSAAFRPPWHLPGGTADHLLGTDGLGRDILSRILHGARYSLQIGVVSVGIAALFGVFLGAIAGFFPATDNAIMRVMDVMLAFPSILLAIVIVATLGPGLINAMIAVGIVAIPQYARLVRGSVLTVRVREYVAASAALGASDLRVLSRTVMPNCLSPLIVQCTMGFATAILDAAGLSFLGLGARPPTPEWGALLHEGFQDFLSAWWVVTFPGVAVFLAVLGFNLLGDGLRDILDPRASG